MGNIAKAEKKNISVPRSLYIKPSPLNQFFETENVSFKVYVGQHIRLWVLGLISGCGLTSFVCAARHASYYAISLPIVLAVAAVVSEIIRFTKTYDTPEWANGLGDAINTYNSLAMARNLQLDYATEEAVALKTVPELVKIYWEFSSVHHYLTELLLKVQSVPLSDAETAHLKKYINDFQLKFRNQFNYQ